MRARRLDSVGLIGGEPTLHPQLLDIVRLVRDQGLTTELLSNGVLLDDAYADALRDAGLDLAVLHIEKGQERPDLPPGATTEMVEALQEQKAAMLGRHGIRAGLALTVHPDSLDEMRSVIRVSLRCPNIDFLLITTYRDGSWVGPLHGTFSSGFAGDPPESAQNDSLENAELYRLLRDEFDLTPYGYLCSNLDSGDPRWLTYMVAVCGDGARIHTYSITPSLFEPLYGRIFRLIHGRYPFGTFPKPGIIKAQLLINGLFGGSLRGNLRFLARARRANKFLKTKRFAIQAAAVKMPDGRLLHCKNCPDAVVKNGRLVPVCVTDFFER